MDDSISILSAKFDQQSEFFHNIAGESKEIIEWFTTLSNYVLENEKKEDEQKIQEANLRKQRLNAEHQLSQLEKQLISCNTKLTKYEKNLLDVKTKLMKSDDVVAETERKLEDAVETRKKVAEENEKLTQKYAYLEDEKLDFSEVIDKKNKEIDRLNEEWNEMSKKLADANKARYEMQYKLDEIKNSDIRKEFKEKRLEQEKNMLLRQLEQVTADLRSKSESVNELQKDKTSTLLSLESKCEQYEQEILQLKLSNDTVKKTNKEQETKIENLMTKLKRTSEERVEAENNMQQELSAQTKLVQLYKEDRDHAKTKLTEITTAVTELQELLKQLSEEKSTIEGRLQAEETENRKTISDLKQKLQEKTIELENANDLLQISKRKGNNVAPDDLSILSPMAAQTSKILKKGMTLTQIYSEYVKVSDELLSEKDENTRLKLYMDQILREVEEKAPLLMKQKEDYEHASRSIFNMSVKMEENIKECHRLKSEHEEYERKLNFHKREEKRLKILCTDLSQQVRILLKEVEEARGGVVSSSETLPELLPNDNVNVSSSGQVISEHLVTFKSIEELQTQNERLLLTVRELSEEQEKLEQEGGSEIIQELKKKIEVAKQDLDALRDNQKTQEDMMEKLCRQRDMYKVLAQKGGVMVGDVSSTSAIGSQSLGSQSLEMETELTKARAELDNTLMEHTRLKSNAAAKEKGLNEKISKQEEELSTLRLEHDRLKNKLDFAEEKHTIIRATSEGYKREATALEQKCKTITEALSKVRVEAEKYKQEYYEAKERLVAAEVNVKSSETEKHLIKEAEKRLMQENQSLLDQQRSQNVLLTNLQTIQNNLERQEFETRKTFSKQVDTLQREIRALRRQNDSELNMVKTTNTALEKETKELKIQMSVELEKNKSRSTEVELSQHKIDALETKCKEFEALHEASEKRLNDILQSDGTDKVKEDFEHETERYKTKIREMELLVSNAVTEKKTLEDQLEVTKRHLQQYQEIAQENEQAIKAVEEKLEAQSKAHEEQLNEAREKLKSFKNQVSAVVAEKIALKKSSELAEQQFMATIQELRTQSAPMERRLQEVTRALVSAKELENTAVRESQEQANIAKEASEKYERELVLHARDVEQLTALKDELQASNGRYGGMEERLSEIKQTLDSNNRLMDQMKDHHSKELRKGEQARKDLISQNAILHGQVEKLSAQLASAKSQNKTSESIETSTDKSLEEVYELLRFVRREKEISETKAEAAETESMRYRQRAEHLQRDLDETKAALELELERTKGRMLTEEEHKEVSEKVKRCKEYEVLNKHLEKEKTEYVHRIKLMVEKEKGTSQDVDVKNQSRKLDAELKPLQEVKKALENEKSSWLAEKTALKAEIERWTSRTNQLMAQNVKSDSEELKKVQALKAQGDKILSATQDDLKRTKQQLDMLRRESLKLKADKTEAQTKIQSLQTELTTAQQQTSVNKGTVSNKVDNEQMTNLQKEMDEIKKNLETKTTEVTDKNNIIQQLRKVARKYKTLSDKLQNLLKENNIDYSNVTKATPNTASDTASVDQTKSSSIDPEEKKKLETVIEQKTKALELLSQTFNELQHKYNSEKVSSSEASNKVAKFEETQARYMEAEKKVLTLTSDNEKLQKELNDEKEKVEKNKKLIKTARDRITQLSKLKEAKMRDIDSLTKEKSELQSKFEQLTSRQQQEIEEKTKQLQEQVNTLQVQVDSLTNEKHGLSSKMDELLSVNEKLLEEKRVAETLLKASQQKSRLQSSSSSSSEMTQQADSSATPLTATVRPTVEVAAAKFHPQTTTAPTASIRPLAHTAPTAMISPTVSVTQTSTVQTPVAITHPVQPQTTTDVAAAVQPVQARMTTDNQQSSSSSSQPRGSRPLERGAGFKAPVARVSSQETNVDDTVVPNIDDQLEAEQSSSSTTNETRPSTSSKRSHAFIEDTQEMEDVTYLADVSQEEPGSKRLRIETSHEQQTSEESQDALEEDELLGEANEEADDEVMETASQQEQTITSSREAQLQMERSMQPSPQELLRQRSRGRSQLPSFSLMPGQGGSGFYEETDDSTVPSTPTLYMPKRTDGFAEAVSSPLIRLPTFSFGGSDQGSSTSSHPRPNEATGDTHVNLISPTDEENIPQTPLSVVPSVVSSEQPNNEYNDEVQRDQFFPEDNGQEQNVPQQIDLTEEDEEDNDDDDDGVQQQVGNQDEAAEDDDRTEADEIYAGDEVVNQGTESDSESTTSDDDDDEEEEEEDEEEDQDETVPQIEGAFEEDGNDVIEVNVAEGDLDYPEEEEEEEEEAPAVTIDDEQIGEEEEASEQQGLQDVDDDGDGDVISIDETSRGVQGSEMMAEEMQEATSSSVADELSQDTKIEETDKPKPVRLQRTRGVRPIVRKKPNTNTTNKTV